LTTEAIPLGIGASYIIGVYLLGIDNPTYFWTNMLKYTNTSTSLPVFSIRDLRRHHRLVGCYKGMACGEGAEGVGRSTTEAVVYSSITILITNFF